MAEVKLLAWLLLIPLVPYCLYLLYIYRCLAFKPAERRGNAFRVFVSVIIPCRNEEKRLPAILNDLVLQDFSRDNFEVIIVDDNSEDDTSRVVTTFNGIKNLKIIRNPGRGKKSAIKNGVKAALGELILTTDADCRVKSSWISSIAGVYSDMKPDLIISPVLLEEGHRSFEWFQQLEFISLQAVTEGTALAGRPVLCNGANLAFPASVYRKNSGKLREDILSGDDIFLLQSIRRSGGKIVWNGEKDSTVLAAAARSPGQFVKQRARWLSKAGVYHDNFTIILSIVALFTNISVASLLIGCIPAPGIFLIWLTAFLIKSIPDFLLLHKITVTHNKTNLLWWFIPSQVIYPFYVIIVSAYSLFRRNSW